MESTGRGIRRVVAACGVAWTVVVLTAACAPLPADTVASLCPSQASTVPPSYVDAPAVTYFRDWPETVPAPAVEVLDRLAVIPGDFTVSANPFVTVRLRSWDAAGQDLAARLRAEFGALIDIEVGAKRLGGGPNGRTGSCVITAPTWSVAAGPKAMSIRVITAPSYDRTAPVTATLRITNHSRRAIRVAPAPNVLRSACWSSSDGESLARPGSALNVNRGKGTPAPNDPAPLSWPEAGRSWWAPSSLLDHDKPHGPIVCELPLRIFMGVRVPPRGHADLVVAASTTSVTAGDDPILEPGRYDLRATFAVRPDGGGGSTMVDEYGVVAPWKVVAAPPAPVTLR